MPKILLIDIETSPNLGYVWGKWQQDVIAFEKEWYILCYTVKWLGEKGITTVSLPQFKFFYSVDPEDDRKVVESLWKWLDKADIVIAQNGDEFDLKKINARFAIHGLKPPSPYKTIDTLKQARRYFGFTSNKLGDLAKYLGIREGKLDTTFGLWRGCMAGDPKSWATMERYNRRDVEILEAVYNRLKPWDTYHPVVGAYKDETVCSRCGSNDIQSRGLYVAKTITYRRFHCQSCGGWMRSYKREMSRKPLVSV